MIRRGVEMRVDVVIPWVDGSDPVWRARRNQYASELTDSTGNAEQHFRDNGELRYLLRSIEKYWPFSGDIILVTAGQTPDFIDPDSGIRVVHHQDILEKQFLPTFSSRAVMSALHRIENLSERFVVFSDDIFLCREATMEDFFGTRGARVYLSNEPIHGEHDEDLSRYHHDAFIARELIRGYVPGEGLGHIISPHPQGLTRSIMHRLEARFPEQFLRARADRFITKNTPAILPYLYYEYAHAVGYADIVTEDTLFLYGYDLGNTFMRDAVKNAVDNKFTFCIQDTLRRKRDVIDFRAQLEALLSEIFPEPSRWERCPGE